MKKIFSSKEFQAGLVFIMLIAFYFKSILGLITLAFLVFVVYIAYKEHTDLEDEDLDEEKINNNLQLFDELFSDINKQQSTRKKEPIKNDPLKQKGDLYERFIGKQFEKKGDLVIYNGFIKGYDDEGVDIISISLKTKTINLIQCKNWTKKPMLLDDIKSIYNNLNNFNLDRICRDSYSIKKHLYINKSLEDISSVLKQNKNDFLIRKTLYVGSEKVIDLNIGKFLTLIKPNIFRYSDMKIVIKEI